MVGCPQRNLLVVERIKPRTLKPNGMIGTIEMLYELESTDNSRGLTRVQTHIPKAKPLSRMIKYQSAKSGIRFHRRLAKTTNLPVTVHGWFDEATQLRPMW